MDISNRNWILESQFFANVGKSTSLLEVGSFIVEGQEDIQPRVMIQPMVGRYVGLDMRAGRGVDVVADASNMPFQAEFDYVICLDTLEHAQWPRDCVREMFRVLKPGGCMFLATVFNFPIHDYPSDYWRFTPACMRLLAEDAGFIVEENLDDKDQLQPGIVKVIGRKP